MNSNYIVLRKTDTEYEIRNHRGVGYPYDVRDLAVLTSSFPLDALDYMRLLCVHMKLQNHVTVEKERELIYAFNERAATFRQTIEPVLVQTKLLELQRKISSKLQDIVNYLGEKPKPPVYKPIHVFEIEGGLVVSASSDPVNVLAVEYFDEKLLEMAYNHITIDLNAKHPDHYTPLFVKGVAYPKSSVTLVKDFKSSAAEFRGIYAR